MKIKFDTEKIINFVRANLKYLSTTLAVLIVIVFAILTYMAVNPSADNDHILEGEARVQSLDIRFNTKLLGELSTTKTPTTLGTSGGRDPFSGF